MPQVMIMLIEYIENIIIFISVKGRPSGSVPQLAECPHGKRQALCLSPGRASIFSSLVTFMAQCGFTARAMSIKRCMPRCSSLVPSRFWDESN